jgi:tRNA pseudouridine38-40 synthase
MAKYKLIISYDGSNYVGWQSQLHGEAIQAIIEGAVSCLLQAKTAVIGASRTDAGVHAMGQVAHFNSITVLDIFKVKHSLNCMLPRDIKILHMEEVEESFNARFSAKGKVYHYHLCLNRVQIPFRRLYSWHVRQEVDIELIKKAALNFIGEKDFTSFANEGGSHFNPVRHLKRLDILEECGGEIRLEFEGNGFLYKMVRNITGTLVDIGAKKIALDKLEAIFKARDRRKAGTAAPACGLFLMKVFY